jgi:hypothetical protein
VDVNRLPLLGQAVELWREIGRPPDLLEQVRRQGEQLWLAIRGLTSGGAELHVLVVVPQDDILGEAHKERQRMAMVIGMGFLAAIGLAFWLSTLYTRPLSALVHRSHAIQRLDLASGAEVHSRVKEGQELNAAQAAMSAKSPSVS